MREQRTEAEEYTVVATNLLLKPWRDMLRFSVLAGAERELANSPGLIRYQLKVDLPKLQFPPVPVWESHSQLDSFVGKGDIPRLYDRFPRTLEQVKISSGRLPMVPNR